MLTYGKLLDDIKDERGFKRLCKRIIKPLFSHIGKKSDNFEGLKDIVFNGLAATDEAEANGCDSVDRAADGFGQMMKEIASYGLDSEKKMIAEQCGYHIGRFVYIADAFDDLESDEKNGNYNPLLKKYGSAEKAMEAAENIKETLWDSLNAFSNFYALAVNQPINGIDRIIFNIVELGGRDAVKRIIERKNKK